MLSVLRRLISGKPCVFTADREHIHHKLLQLGMSHRKVVIVLYAVSGVRLCLACFCCGPSRNTLGLVLAVLGIGVWFGVQHLGYLELASFAGSAQRTISSRRYSSTTAIRRATEELKVTSNYDQLIAILEAAFCANDFDAFDYACIVCRENICGCSIVVRWASRRSSPNSKISQMLHAKPYAYSEKARTKPSVFRVGHSRNRLSKSEHRETAYRTITTFRCDMPSWRSL